MCFFERVKMKKLLYTVGLILICGCSPSSPSELRQNYEGKDVFEVNQPSSAVYRKIMMNARERYGSSLTGDYYQDTKEGHINLTQIAPPNPIVVVFGVWFVIDIYPINESKTRIITYHARHWKKIITEVHQWCNDPTP